MFDAERLLGRMITGGLRRSTRRIGTGAMAMGLLGVAFAAIEHLGQKDSRKDSPGSQPPPPPRPSAGPPPPPPPPGRSRQDEALLLVRSMVAAAAADGSIDTEERGRIMAHLTSSGAGAEERAFVEQEMASPASPEILARATKPGWARQVYAASLLAIDVDSPAEKEYLARLARALELDETTVESLHRDLGIQDHRSGRERE